MEILADTRIAIWEGASLWLVDAVPSALRVRQHTDVHAHHAIQVVVSLGGTFRIETNDGALSGDVAAVAADSPHRFEAEGRIALVFIEPESRAGRAIRSGLFGEGGLAAPSPASVEDFCATILSTGPAPTAPRLAEAGRDLIERLAGDGRSTPLDWRVGRMIAHAAEHLEGRVTLADVVSQLRVSSSRLSHLFVAQTGLPFRTYVLWLRLSRAVEAIIAGATLTQAAHQAGFADAPHFSRTFRRMFGVAPASLRIL